MRRAFLLERLCEEMNAIRMRSLRRLLPDGLALVDTGQGEEEEVSIALVDAAAGDRILVHAREAIAVVQT